MEVVDDHIDWGGHGRPRVWPDWLFDGTARRLDESDLVGMAGPIAGEDVLKRFREYRERIRGAATHRGVKIRTKMGWVKERGEVQLTLLVQAILDVPF